MQNNRRDFFRLAGSALWVTAGAAACTRMGGPTPRTPGDPAPTPPDPDATRGFLMMQISDTHWGYEGPANPDPHGAIARAITEIAAWPRKPDLVVHTGDVSQMTTDVGQRKARLAEAKEAFSKLGVELRAIPGEHDASLDRGAIRDIRTGTFGRATRSR